MAINMSRSACLMGFLPQVDSLGGNRELLLEKAGIPASWLDSDDNLIPAQKIVELIESTALEMNCPDFGLQMARFQSFAILGPVGLLIQQCDTLGDALCQLKKFLHVHNQAVMLDIQLTSEMAYITFEPMVDYQGRTRQTIELTMAAGWKILKELAGEDIRLSSVFFSYRKPRDLALYQSIFECPLTFDREVCGAAIPQKLLNLPIHSDISDTRKLLNTVTQAIERTNPIQLEERIRILIRQLLPIGQCGIEPVSQLLQVEVRTLQRRLKERGTSFQQLLANEREELAKRYLKESEVNMSHLADLLGFAELSVFSSSFKRWTGMTPTQFLRQETDRLKYQ